VNTENALTYVDASSKFGIRGTSVQEEEESTHVLHRVNTAHCVKMLNDKIFLSIPSSVRCDLSLLILFN
jgi:hypothetical protein